MQESVAIEEQSNEGGAMGRMNELLSATGTSIESKTSWFGQRAVGTKVQRIDGREETLDTSEGLRTHKRQLQYTDTENSSDKSTRNPFSGLKG